MLHRLCKKFLEDRLIRVEQEDEDSLLATSGPFQVMYEYNGTMYFEFLSVEKQPESGLVMVRDTKTTENEATISITKGCLPDYLTLLRHSRYPFARYVRERFEPYHQRPFPADTVFEEQFPQCNYLVLMHLLRTFYPTTKKKII